MDWLGHFFELRIQPDVHARGTSSQRLSNEASIVVGAPEASIQQDTDALRVDKHRGPAPPVILPPTAFHRCPRCSRFPRPLVPTGWGSRRIRTEEVENRCRSTPRSFPRGSRRPCLLPGTAPGRRPVGHGKPGEWMSSVVFRSEERGRRAVDSSRMVDEARGISRRWVATILWSDEKRGGAETGL